MDAGEFIAIDIETDGGSIDNIPHGFRLLLAGVRCGKLLRHVHARPGEPRPAA